MLLRTLILLALPLAAQQDRVVGAVESVNAETKEIAIHTDAGKTVRAKLAGNARLVRIEPGEKDLNKAAPVEFSTLAVGDRVIARGALSEDSLTANMVVVMTKSSIAGQHAKEQAEWKKRSLGGVVVSVDADAHEVRMKARNGGPDLKEWTVAVPDAAVLKRYAEGSVKYEDATPAPLAAIQTGDQIRVLGQRDDTQTKVTAEQIVSGSFQTLGGEISSVKIDAGEITMKDLQTKKPVVIRLSAESNIRRMPSFGGGGGGGGYGGGMRPAGGGGGPSRRPDLAQVVDRLPAATLGDLKPGDAVIVSVAKSSGGKPVTAITLVTGMDFLLRASAAQVSQTLGNWNTEMSMPGQ